MKMPQLFYFFFRVQYKMLTSESEVVKNLYYSVQENNYRFKVLYDHKEILVFFEYHSPFQLALVYQHEVLAYRFEL